CLQDVQLPSTF
nr:immunoglobulin light chain junction region [Macaca mulatta]MOX23562.1 immunoglobulin light chain junction region [Macaca mulatta]MOX23575.1 immunoglobulin light chain junction region [Macaca mulatta]MOX23612.1 immunoglobulin light chain junction region [Macaca mulatta]MOX23649.1 immunoglobulin light chain junction region [Macaca mulatta]